LSVATGNYVVIFIPALIVLLLTGFFKAENFKQELFINSIGYVVILSFFGTALAKVLYTKLVQMSTPVFASSVTYIMPIVALFWGVLDGETFSWTQGLGSLIILLGVFLANRKQKKIRSN
ncbi:MAG: DMT family transporter, partial [Flavobacteriaceae bacterium]|nr:DMT family transporter [Flavobacteriaceae bacterium]